MSTHDHAARASRRRLWVALIPLVAFAILAALFIRGLTGIDPKKIPSALINKPVPAFDLPGIAGLTGADGKPFPGFASADLKAGKVSVVNVWASWCIPCRAEHPLLTRIAADTDIALIGINYKDKPDNARAFLAELGNPFARIGADANGRVGIDWGVYGVPETFLVDGRGIIRYKWIGPLSEQSLNRQLLPRIKALKAESAGG